MELGQIQIQRKESPRLSLPLPLPLVLSPPNPPRVSTPYYLYCRYHSVKSLKIPPFVWDQSKLLSFRGFTELEEDSLQAEEEEEEEESQDPSQHSFSHGLRGTEHPKLPLPLIKFGTLS